MSATYAPESPSSVGLGRPSSMDTNRPDTLTASLSLSSLASSSSLNSLSPLPLSRSHYSTAAHHFIQRQPQKALIALEDARRLSLKVISHDDELRKNSAWIALREKVAILWITLLVSFAKKEHGSDVSNIYDQLPKETVELLRSSASPSIFLPRLTTEVLAAWATDASEEAIIRNAKDEHHAEVRHRLLGSIPAAVAASLIMANLSIEEAAVSTSGSSSGSSSTKGQAHQPSPNAHPLTRDLAEELLSSLSGKLDHEQTDSPAESVLTAYSRVLELYSIHVLGVRCDQWDYADQLIRLSLLQDEPRAKLLLALQRAQTHISTRPQRRASALLAQQKAYEAEKQRRASSNATEAKTKIDEGAESDPSTAGSANRRSKTNGTKLRRSSSSSAPTSESEAESQSGSTVTRRKQDQSSKSGFAATRAHLSNTIARHHGRDTARDTEAQSASTVSSRATSQNVSSTSTLSMIQRYLTYLRSRSGLSAIISILAPLIVLIFSIRRLTLGRQRAGRNPNNSGGGRAGDEQSVMRKVLGSILGTLKMGTQVTYL